MKDTTRFLAILLICLPPIFGTAQPVNSVIGDVQPASPEVAALARFSEIPISTFTGAASVSIPIHVLREGPLEVPISLNHHNSGVRVGETASWIGLGWSMSGGGVISRTILGLPDDNSQGILNQDVNYSAPLTRSEVGEGSIDGEPDLFSFHFPGGSGKFIFDGDHLTVLQFPHSNMRITVDSEDLNEFVITTTDGTRYIFGSATTGDYHGFMQTASEQAIASAILRSTGRSITEWYLRRIESFDGRYAIDYTYRDETYTAIAPSSQEWSEIYGAGPTGGFEGDRDYRGNFQVLPRLIVSIPASSLSK